MSCASRPAPIFNPLPLLQQLCNLTTSSHNACVLLSLVPPPVPLPTVTKTEASVSHQSCPAARNVLVPYAIPPVPFTACLRLKTLCPCSYTLTPHHPLPHGLCLKRSVFHRLCSCRLCYFQEWHQKLHNNTTPDDVPICEAYLAFLSSEGNKDAYWRVLSDAG